MQKWYLSFVDHNKFMGACVVEGDTLQQAIKRAWELHINPGGEVLGIDIQKETNLPLNKLMDRAELEQYGPVTRYGDDRNPPQQIGLN